MKRTSFIYAAAAVCMFCACNRESTLDINKGDAISFRSLMGTITKGDGEKTGAALESFSVSAMKGGTQDVYFDNAVFSLDEASSTYLSADPYYWPLTGSLDFYAFAPQGNTQVERKAYNSFSVTPDQTASTASQADLVYAISKGHSKTSSAAGVSLHFQHAMSKVVVKVKTSQPNLKFKLEEMKLGFIQRQGDVVIPSDISTESGELLSKDYWTSQAVPTAADCYIQACNLTIQAADVAAAAGNALILVPQQTAAATGYTENDQPNGGFIALKGSIYNATDGTRIFPDSDNGEYMIFPAEFNLLPGKQYTYIVDLGNGGYRESGDPDIPGTEELDPVTQDSIIKFVQVTVEGWQVIDKNV